MNRLTRRATLGAATAFALTQGARAQAYPNKPIRILVPFPAGGIVDIVTRALADPMQADLGQTIVVEPKPGGNATLATAMIPQAPADGYNWRDGHDQPRRGAASAAGALRSADGLPAGGAGRRRDPVATVNPSVPVKTLKELVEYAQGQSRQAQLPEPGQRLVAPSFGRALKNQYKLDMTAVPYRGMPPGVPDLLEGRLQVGWLPAPLAIQHVQNGKLRALAVLGDKRLATLPDVPTFAEAGFADAQVISWYVIAVRAGTPAPIVERLHASAMKALADPATRDRLTKAGCEVPPPRSPAEVLAMWKADYARYGKLVKEAGIKGES